MIKDRRSCRSFSQSVAAVHAKRVFNSQWDQIKVALVVHFLAAKYPEFSLNFTLFYELQLRISSNFYNFTIVIVNVS